jgi:hypothetical protein
MIPIYCSDCEIEMLFDFSVELPNNPGISKDYYKCKKCEKSIFILINDNDD